MKAGHSLGHFLDLTNRQGCKEHCITEPKEAKVNIKAPTIIRAINIIDAARVVGGYGENETKIKDHNEDNNHAPAPHDAANFRRRFKRMLEDGVIEPAPGRRQTRSKPAAVYRVHREP